MDIAIKIFFSAWFVFIFGIFVFGWFKTWFVPEDAKPNKHPIAYCFVMSILFLPHAYMIYNGLMYLGIDKKYFVFIFLWLGINVVKAALNTRHSFKYASYCAWETIMYIPGIIYIFQH